MYSHKITVLKYYQWILLSFKLSLKADRSLFYNESLKEPEGMKLQQKTVTTCRSSLDVSCLKKLIQHKKYELHPLCIVYMFIMNTRGCFFSIFRILQQSKIHLFYHI